VTLSAAKITDDSAKKYPGDTFKADFTVTFSAWTDANYIKPPYTLYFQLTPTDHPNSDLSWEDWTWGSSCTNTQFG